MSGEDQSGGGAVAPSQLGEEMRLALRRLAKAVVIITARHEHARFAMAATAVSELSLEPPSLLICVNQTASLHSPLLEGANFCVNILDCSQEEIAHLCSGAKKGEARFGRGEWDEIENVPVLRGAQACFVCRNDRNFEYGTHRIFIGEVLAASTHGAVDPLIYLDRRYARVAPVES